MALTKVSGSVLKNPLSLSGNVSVGGTLTYEDVTNVDAVGVVTAREGIRVGAGKSIGSDGAAVVYYGDGSNLTGISAGVSLANGANNRIITATGANALTGESGLTFSSDRLILTNTSTPQIRINNDTSDGSGTRFVFGKATANNNFFNGAVAGDSCIGFPSTLLFGVGTSEKLRIDSSGRVLIGTVSYGDSAADDLTIATTGTTGITIRSGSSNRGQIFFSRATSGTGQYEGSISYQHSTDSLQFSTDHTERLRITSSGYIKHTGLRSGNSENKLAILTTPSYNTSEEDVALYIAENESGINQITFGGGTSAYNAATNIRFLTASAVNTTTGTERLRIKSDGNISINNSSGLSSTYSSFKHFSICNNLIFNAANTAGGFAGMQNNAYLNSSGNWVRVNNDHATSIGTDDGVFYFRNAGAGTGNISWNQRLNILANGNTGIGDADPQTKLHVAGSICGGTSNQPFLRFFDSSDRQRNTKHYFKCVKGSTSIFDILTVDINQNFHQALIILYYGARIQNGWDSTTFPVHKIIGVNRFNGGSIQFTKNTIVQDSTVGTHANIDAVATSSTNYRIRLTWSGTAGGSSFACGSVEIIGVGSGDDGAFWSLSHAHGLLA